MKRYLREAGTAVLLILLFAAQLILSRVFFAFPDQVELFSLQEEQVAALSQSFPVEWKNGGESVSVMSDGSFFFSQKVQEAVGGEIPVRFLPGQTIRPLFPQWTLWLYGCLLLFTCGCALAALPGRAAALYRRERERFYLSGWISAHATGLLAGAIGWCLLAFFGLFLLRALWNASLPLPPVGYFPQTAATALSSNMVQGDALPETAESRSFSFGLALSQTVFLVSFLFTLLEAVFIWKKSFRYKRKSTK